MYKSYLVCQVDVIRMGHKTLTKYIPLVKPCFMRMAERDARLRSEAGERDARLSIEAQIRGAVAQETGEW